MELIQELDAKITLDNEKKKIVGGKIVSSQRDQEISEIDSEMQGLSKLRNGLISGFEEAARSRKNQEELVNKYEKKREELQKNKN